MSVANYQAAVREARDTLSAVDASMHNLPTPCDDWDVAGLIDHMIGAQFFLVQLASGQEITPTATDHVGLFDTATAAATKLFADPAFAERNLELPFGNFTGAQFVDFACLETLAHAWDLAKATGRDTDLAPELAETLLDVAKAMMGPTRPEGNPNFAPETTPHSDATSADRLAAFLGRSVS